MNRSAAWLSAGALSILILSVAGKVAFLNRDVEIDTARLQSRIAATLAARGARVTIGQSLSGPAVSAELGECRMAVRLSGVSGEFRQYVLHDLRSFERTRFAWNGRLASSPPVFRPYADYQISRAANRLGWHRGWAPILAIADNLRCSGAMLDLHGVRAEFRPIRSNN